MEKSRQHAPCRPCAVPAPFHPSGPRVLCPDQGERILGPPVWGRETADFHPIGFPVHTFPKQTTGHPGGQGAFGNRNPGLLLGAAGVRPKFVYPHLALSASFRSQMSYQKWVTLQGLGTVAIVSGTLSVDPLGIDGGKSARGGGSCGRRPIGAFGSGRVKFWLLWWRGWAEHRGDSRAQCVYFQSLTPRAPLVGDAWSPLHDPRGTPRRILFAPHRRPRYAWPPGNPPTPPPSRSSPGSSRFCSWMRRKPLAIRC